MMKEKKKESILVQRGHAENGLPGRAAQFDPRALSKNFVIFVTAIGALVATVVLIRDAAAGQPFGFTLQVTLWLWFTVLFANFAEALAEGRGKAQADALKKKNARLCERPSADGQGDGGNSLRFRAAQGAKKCCARPGTSFLLTAR